MADYSALIGIVRPVIDKLVQLLFDEANLFKDVQREIQSLTDEFETIQCFLKEAEERRDMSDGIKTWVKQVRDEAYHVEDVIDEYILRVAQNTSQRHGIGGFTCKIRHFMKVLVPRHDIASEVKIIKASLHDIRERGKRYNFRSLEQQSSSKSTSTTKSVDPRLGSLFIEETELVSVESLQKDLKLWLIQGPTSRSVTTLVGTGGIGKTTLARTVHEEERIKRHFDCRAWINVSQSYNMEKVLKAMAKQIFQAGESIYEEIDMLEELISHLRQYLQTKRYFIVFDDVWKIDFWLTIKNSLPSNNRGSRIIITTRNDCVANFCKQNAFDTIQKLQPWPLEKSLELFCKKAFQSDFEGHCPQELEQLSLQIVKKCEGLPLVVAAIAGLLSTKRKIMSEWQKICDDVNAEFQTNVFLSRCSEILSLSYHDLSHELKPCFLYFGLYPKNYSISYPKLYGKWITEGFVKETRSKTVEQVAEEILTELIDRNLVQSWEGQHGFRYIQVHDLMHEIILVKAAELGFSQILDEKTSGFVGKTRRLSICHAKENIFESLNDSRVRSILFYNVSKLTVSYLATMFKKFKLLKVLDFTDVHLDCLPEELGNLFHLNYLSLLNTKLNMLPKSIGKLQNLKIFDMRNTLVHKLPKEINNLYRLRHLLANFRDEQTKYSLTRLRGVAIPEGIGSLDNLQTLITVEVNPGRFDIVKELEKLKQLRALSISQLNSEMGRALCGSIEKMSHLVSLELYAINNSEALDLQHMSPPRLLHNLSILSRLEKLPDWISSLHNLSRLNLSFSRLTDDLLKQLDKLPELEHLFLYNAYVGEQLHFEDNGFQKLKTLRLRVLPQLNAMIIGKGALPRIEKIEIGPCPLLKELPSDFQHLQNLKSLAFYSMDREFMLGLQPNGGSQYWIVKNIPNVCFRYRVNGNHYNQEWKLGDPDLLEHLQQ